jgi:hypothetical protein
MRDAVTDISTPGLGPPKHWAQALQSTSSRPVQTESGEGGELIGSQPVPLDLVFEIHTPSFTVTGSVSPSTVISSL